MSLSSLWKARTERKKVQKAAYKERKEELKEEKKLTKAEKEARLKVIAARRGIKGADWKKRLKASVGAAVYKKLGDAWEIREFEKAAYRARKTEVSARKREEKIEKAKARGTRKAERAPARKIIAKGTVSGGKAAVKGGKKALAAWDKWYYSETPKKTTGKKAGAKKTATYRKFNGERFRRISLKKLKSEATAQKTKLMDKGDKVRIIKVNGMWEVYSRKG